MKSYYDTYNLFEATDKHITRPRFKAARSRFFYPSEASVQVTDIYGDIVTYGTCMRSVYFRLTEEFEGQPYEARSEYIFRQGKDVENMLIELWKEMGIWVDNNVKFVDYENNISGELDAILAEPPDGQLYLAEVKSFYGYNAKKELFGDKRTKGYPKMGQLLQVLVYLNFFEDKGLPYGRMVYFARDSVDRKTFKIELSHEDNTTYPKVDGVVLRSFSVQDILARYKQLQHYITMKSVPPNDFELQYPNTKIEDYYSKGKIGKTKYDTWKKGKLKKYEYIGDWECNYCKYKNICWNK